MEVSKTPSRRRFFFPPETSIVRVDWWMERRTDDNLYPSIFFIKNTILIYTQGDILKYLDKFPVGLKFWSSWGSGCKNLKTPSRLDFFEIVLKVEKNTKDFPVK